MAKKQTYNFAKGLTLRALRAFIAGFLAVAVTISINDVSSWTELGTALMNLTLAGVTGGITAVIMALDKFLRTE